MDIQNVKNPLAGGADGLSKSVMLGSIGIAESSNTCPAAQEETAAQLPTFFELVAANSVGFLYGIIAYSNSCLSMMDADDPEGFVDAVAKLLREANGLASTARPLKKPTIISHEMADRFEREAAALRDRAYLLETEASHRRAAASLFGRDAP